MKALLLSTLILISSLISYSQTTVIINSDMDNAIFEESTNSSGAGYLFAGQNCLENNRRALVHFDIAGEIPAGATITDVSLILTNDMVSTSVTSQDFTLHPVTTEWGEGTSIGGGSGGSGGAATTDDATWVDALFGSTTWATAGGDFGAAVATTTLPTSTGSFNWNSAGMVANVQAWLDSPGSNFGWILRGSESTTCEARRFGSKEEGTAPSLVIEFVCAPPTAVCKDIDVYLDGTGSFTIDASDLDDGSTATCGIDSFSASKTVFDCSDVGSGPELIISAVYDGPLPGGEPKGAELYVREDIADLSNFGIGFANNGGGTDGEEFTFPSMSVSAGTYLYVASEATNFNSFFGFDPDFTTGFATINGDDAVELFKSGEVIDVFGDPDVDGSGETWDYLDGWAYRNDMTGPETPFNDANWNFSGINALDGETTNASASTPVPIGSYTPSTASGVNVTLTVTGGGGETDECLSTVTVFDTISPLVNCASAPVIELDSSGAVEVTASMLDDGTTDNCGIDSMYTSVDSVSCADIGTMDITLFAVDFYGNVSACATTATIDGSNVIDITTDLVTDVTCNGDMDGAIDVTVSGGSGTYTYDWDNDGTGDFDDAEDLSGLDGGTYELTVTDDDGCSGTTLEVVAEPDAVDTLVAQSGADFTANATGVSYQWYDCGSMTIISGETSQDFTATADGSYACIIDDGGCIDTSSCYTVAGVGFDEEGEALFVNVYPIPVDDILKVAHNQSGALELELFDISGKVVMTKKSSDSVIQLDVSKLEQGMYLLKVSTVGDESVQRVVVR